MAKWLAKVLVQGMLAQLPYEYRWNRLLQRYLTRSLDPTPGFQAKLDQVHRHLLNVERVRGKSEIHSPVLEIGTGVAPIVPVGLFLSGVDTIYSVDTVPLCTSKDVFAVLQLFINYAENGALERMLPSLKPDRIDTLAIALSTNR